ncbi:MAG: hypothetical protein HQK81_08815 [Desulfovibrionaceae bacterium]|nr:hypothetical protein [Desulfovibrionaceae bacterium]MBF0514151.1 hypothetical protein [Desulfovibrionaceae bacterium]
MDIGHWLIRLFKWLTADMFYFWVFMLPVIAGCFLLHFLKTEQYVKTIGILFQVFGFILLVINIYSISRYFNLPTPIEKALEWAYNNPFYPISRHIEYTGSVGMTISGSADIRMGYGSTDNLKTDERINILEKRQHEILDMYQANNERIDKELSIIKQEIKQESSGRRIFMEDVHQKIKETQTDGLVQTLIGTTFLFLGSVICTYSKEVLSIFL